MNLLFIVASLFAVLHLKKRYMFIALGILNGAGFLSHARETLMFNIGIAIYFILMLIFERKSIKAVFKKEQVSKFVAFFKVSCIRNIVLYIASVPITLIFMFRHLPVLGVFKSSASVGITSSWITKFVNYCPQSKFHHVFMSHFGFYKILIFLGVIFGLYFLFKKKNKLMTLTYSFSIAFLLVGYFCVLGNKTTQIRHLWPLVLMAFVGFVAYFAYLLISQKIKSKKIRIVVVVAIFLLLLVPTLVHHKPQKSSEYGFSDPYTWGTMMWIKDNVPQEDTVLEFYGDRHHQITMFYLMKKNFEQVEPKGLIEKIQVNNMSNDFNIFWNVLHFYMIKDEKEGLKVIPRPYNLTHSFESVCDYEYLFSDKISQNQVVQDYVVRYLNKIIQEGLFVPVYENELSVVLKNAGGDC